MGLPFRAAEPHTPRSPPPVLHPRSPPGQGPGGRSLPPTGGSRGRGRHPHRVRLPPFPLECVSVDFRGALAPVPSLFPPLVLRDLFVERLVIDPTETGAGGRARGAAWRRGVQGPTVPGGEKRRQVKQGQSRAAWGVLGALLASGGGRGQWHKEGAPLWGLLGPCTVQPGQLRHGPPIRCASSCFSPNAARSVAGPRGRIASKALYTCHSGYLSKPKCGHDLPLSPSCLLWKARPPAGPGRGDSLLPGASGHSVPSPGRRVTGGPTHPSPESAAPDTDTPALRTQARYPLKLFPHPDGARPHEPHVSFSLQHRPPTPDPELGGCPTCPS